MWHNWNIINSKKYKKYSQNQEDGIIEHLLKSTNSYNDFYIEIGTQDGTECNSRLLKENGVKGICFDGAFESNIYNIKKEKFFIQTNYETNLQNILDKYKIGNNLKIGMFSVDIDSFDIWIVRSLLVSIYNKKIQPPTLLVIERNPSYGTKNLVYFPTRQPTDWCWEKDKGQLAIFADGSKHKAGSSVKAFDTLLNMFNYKRVFGHGPNVFYIHINYLPDNFVSPEDSK